MASKQAKPGAVLFGKNLPQLARFYAEVAELSITLEEKDLIVLESKAMQLVLHGIPARIAKSIVITSPPKKREGAALKLILPIESFAKARDKAIACGGGLNPEKKEFAVRGFRACDGFDPEGNVIQFRMAEERLP